MCRANICGSLPTPSRCRFVTQLRFGSMKGLHGVNFENLCSPPAFWPVRDFLAHCWAELGMALMWQWRFPSGSASPFDWLLFVISCFRAATCSAVRTGGKSTENSLRVVLRFLV
mmetsp:Transcript_48880/g.95868  ORF Transcript_48880/g.95868 Transcript_48880/m.95868 type:complete len:114 (-) Transcript_48880:227-568(-)